MELPFRDKIYLNIEVHLSFLDKIRILFGAEVKLIAEIDTQNEVGDTRSSSSIKIGKEKDKFFADLEKIRQYQVVARS